MEVIKYEIYRAPVDANRVKVKMSTHFEAVRLGSGLALVAPTLLGKHPHTQASHVIKTTPKILLHML